MGHNRIFAGPEFSVELRIHQHLTDMQSPHGRQVRRDTRRRRTIDIALGELAKLALNPGERLTGLPGHPRVPAHLLGNLGTRSGASTPSRSPDTSGIVR